MGNYTSEWGRTCRPPGEEVSGSAEEVTATLHDQSAMVQRLYVMAGTIEQLTKEVTGLLPDNQ